MTTITDEANAHLETAYKLLHREGLSEKFFPLAVDVGQVQWGRFFGQFGSETGFFLEFQQSTVPCEVSVIFGVRRYRQTLWEKLGECWSEIWTILRGRDSTFSVHLADEDVTKLKDILRKLK